MRYTLVPLRTRYERDRCIIEFATRTRLVPQLAPTQDAGHGSSSRGAGPSFEVVTRTQRSQMREELTQTGGVTHSEPVFIERLFASGSGAGGNTEHALQQALSIRMQAEHKLMLTGAHRLTSRRACAAPERELARSCPSEAAERGLAKSLQRVRPAA